MSKFNHMVHVLNTPENLKILQGCTSFTHTTSDIGFLPRLVLKPMGYTINLHTQRYWKMYYTDSEGTYITKEQLEVLILLAQMQVPWELIVENIRSKP